MIRIYPSKEKGFPIYIIGDKESLTDLLGLVAVAIKNGSSEMKADSFIQIACVEPSMMDKMPPSSEGDNGSAIFLYEYNKARKEKASGG